MHRNHILEKVKAGESVEVSWVLLVNGVIPQQSGFTADESITKWAKDNGIFISRERRDHLGKETEFVTFHPQ